MFDKYDRNNVKFYHENNVLSSTSQGLLSQFIDILACVFDIFNECNYRYNTTFPLFNKMLKQFVFIKQHCIYPFRTIFNPERAVTEDAVGRFNRKHLYDCPSDWKWGYVELNLKDARSVSLYPYNRSQIEQYVKYTKQINIKIEIANFCDKKCVLVKKVKITTTTKT